MSQDTARSRSNEAWLADLRSDGQDREQALADLRQLLLAGLRRGLTKWLEPYSDELEGLAEETTQEALLRILDRLETFEGRSQFTTWAYKVAIHLALSELRRKQWRDVSLDAMLDPEAGPATSLVVADDRPGPEAIAEQRDLLERVGRIVGDELSDQQMAMMEAITVRGVPMEALAQKLGIERNALYKRMHDARLRLKRRLMLEGLDPADVLAVFEAGNSEPGQVVKKGDA